MELPITNKRDQEQSLYLKYLNDSYTKDETDLFHLFCITVKDNINSSRLKLQGGKCQLTNSPHCTVYVLHKGI